MKPDSTEWAMKSNNEPKKPATSRNTTGAASSPSWFHVSSSNDSSSVPNPPGNTITPSDSSAIRALRSCIEPVTSSALTPEVRDLRADEVLGDHPDDLATGGERSVGNRPHQPDPSTAVDQPVPALGDTGSELHGHFAESVVTAGVRTTEHCDARHGPIVAREAGKGARRYRPVTSVR